MEKNNRITPRPWNVRAPVVHGSPSSVHSPRFPDCGESALQPHVPASSRAVTNVMLEHAKTLASVITAAYPKNKASPVPRSRAFSLNPPRRGIRQIFEIQEDREGQRWTLICRLSLGFGRCSRTRPLLLPNGPGNKLGFSFEEAFSLAAHRQRPVLGLHALEGCVQGTRPTTLFPSRRAPSRL